MSPFRSSPIRSVSIEACVDSVAAAVAAQELGVARVELCAGLCEGGTTPSLGLVQLARRELRIPLQVIIRPRGGDFCYSRLEFEIIRRDIELAKQTGVAGIVVGILREDGTIDAPRMRSLLALARPLQVTFHRAFDMTRDPRESLESLVDLGVDRILTSGQAATALEGLPLITALVAAANGRIQVMPGGGVTEQNIGTILAQSGATEIHVRAAGLRDSPMRYRNSRVKLSGQGCQDEYQLPAVDSPRLRACVRAVAGE